MQHVWNRARALVMAGLGCGSLLGGLQAAELSPPEAHWLQGALPVIRFARESRLPLDIVVQPQPSPGVPPMAMAFIEGRCKLVFSLRENPEAQATLERLAPALQQAGLELMAAHELAHCRRHLDGAWYGLPAGLAPLRPPEGLAPELRESYQQMQAVRREEGYADLVGLAWVQQRHAALYPRLHAWLVAERSAERIPGSHHDTLAWLRMAVRDAGPADRSIFAGPQPLWEAGLGLAP